MLFEQVEREVAGTDEEMEAVKRRKVLRMVRLMWKVAFELKLSCLLEVE